VEELVVDDDEKEDLVVVKVDDPVEGGEVGVESEDVAVVVAAVATTPSVVVVPVLGIGDELGTVGELGAVGELGTVDDADWDVDTGLALSFVMVNVGLALPESPIRTMI